jgi:hypothetical protein
VAEAVEAEIRAELDALQRICSGHAAASRHQAVLIFLHFPASPAQRPACSADDPTASHL